MLIKNVMHTEQPKEYEIRKYGRRADVVINEVTGTVENEDGTGVQYIVNEYHVETEWTPLLESRVANNKSAWLSKAKIPMKQEPTLPDILEAVNVLTDIVIGEEF